MKLSEKLLFVIALTYAGILGVKMLKFPDASPRPVAVVRTAVPTTPATPKPTATLPQHDAPPHGFALWRGKEPKLPSDWGVTNPSGSYADLAYVMVLSNEMFVDGAMVMGASLREHSEGLKSGKMQLTIVVTAGRLCNASIGRLIETGFDVLVEVPGLAPRAPKSGFKDTFDKSYVFALTVHKKIVFMDADMLAVRSPDALFAKDYGPDEHWVGAIGFRDRDGDYFQTGMMVLRPNAAVFKTIMEEFDANVPPRGKRYNHAANGRDGVLLRTVFGSRFKSIDNKYSRNLNPRYRIPESVVCIHLRGKHKPWFDWRGPVADPEMGKKEFGFTYLAWWAMYETIHKQSAEYREALEGHVLKGYGGRHASSDVTPLTHVWMLRYTDNEYVQLLSEVDRQRSNVTDPSLVLEAGALGESCDQVCKAKSRRCAPTFFNSSFVQDCAKLRRVFGCAECELAVYWRPHPHSDFPGFDSAKKLCKWNLMRDPRSSSTCAAFNETTRRFCPCL